MTDRASVAALDDIAETLLIPLAARALAPRLNPDMGFRDPVAETVLAGLDVDPERFAGDQGSMRGSIVRTRWFDRVAADFLAAHPSGLVVCLGAGLDGRAQRVGFGDDLAVRWIDADVAEVTTLRERLVVPPPGAENRVIDLNHDGWIDALPWRTGQPALFLAEGVMMYLVPAVAERMIRALAGAAERREARLVLAFDYASPWLVRNSRRHPSVRKTNARFRWALSGAADLATIVPDLRPAEQFDITASSGWVPAMLGGIHRLLTGRAIYACARFERP